MSPSSLDLRGAFGAVVDAVHEARIPHAFIGALPVLAWGRVRATTDLDVVVLAEGYWERLEKALLSRGIEPRRTVGPADPADPLPDIAVFQSSGEPAVRVDVFIAKTAFEREVIARAREALVMGAPVRLASPEASIIYKLLAHRPRDIEDVANILEARRAASEALDWDFLEHWASEWGIESRLAPYAERFGPPR